MLSQILSLLEEEIAYVKDTIRRLTCRIHVLASKLNGDDVVRDVYVDEGFVK